MGRKLLWLLLVAALVLGAGWFVYWKMARVAPPPSPVASHWPVSTPAASHPSSAAPAQPGKPSAEPAKGKELSAEPAFVLRAGETLDYDANIAKLNSTVARLKISAVEKRSSGGQGTWHFQALAHTENPYRMVFELDDQFDSYSDAAAMTSVQYEMHLNERGQKVDSVQRMLTSMQEPLPAGHSGARVVPGTRDPLGMLQYLRGADWSHTSQVQSPVFDGHKLYDVSCRLAGRANRVQVPAGTFNTMKVEIRVFDNGQEMKDARFLLYLTTDSARLPVLLEAVLPVATARVELTKAK